MKGIVVLKKVISQESSRFKIKQFPAKKQMWTFDNICWIRTFFFQIIKFIFFVKILF